jgi:hypothetical protein
MSTSERKDAAQGGGREGGRVEEGRGEKGGFEGTM